MLKNSEEIIAVIDSGIGGVAVLKQLIEKHKRGNYIYYADNLNMPYGNKTSEWISQRLDFLISMLTNKYNVSKIIVACNTASTCLNNGKYENVEYLKFDKNQTYFATSLTKKNLKSYNVISDETLAEEIELNIFKFRNLHKIIRNKIEIHHLDQYDNLVLGCTHYELVNSIFQKYLPHTNIVNNSTNVVMQSNINFNLNETNIVILMSRNDNNLRKTILRLLN